MPCLRLAERIAARLSLVEDEEARSLLLRSHSVALSLSPPLFPSKRDRVDVKLAYRLLEEGDYLRLYVHLRALRERWSAARRVQGIAYFAASMVLFLLGAGRVGLIGLLAGPVALASLAALLANMSLEGC